MPTEIRVQLAIINAKPPLRALADVTFTLPDGEIVIRRCAVFERDGQLPWASLPRNAFERNGKKQYVPVLDLPRNLRSRVLESILAEYRRVVDARS